MACVEQKLEDLSTEEGDILMDPTGEDAIEDSCSPVVRAWMGNFLDDYSDPKERERDFLKYYQQHWDSQGFDIDDFPKIKSLMCMTVPIPNAGINERLHGFAVSAMCTYNEKKRTNYEVVGVTKTIFYGVKGYVYRITFEAKDAVAGSGIDTFRAIVYQDIDRSTETKFCELQQKPKREPSSSKVDFTEKECQEISGLNPTAC